MTRLYFLFLLFIPFTVRPQSGKILHLKKINQEIKIDGKIDPIWSTADSAENFFQLSPYFNQKPTWPTVAKVLTTDDALYCLIICYEDKKFIEPYTGTLDNTTGEYVSLMLDTFDDKKTAYKFIVTVSGVKSDARLLDDARTRDYNWDGIWFSATETYDWGWAAEIKVPYKSIQYNKDLAHWGIDFDRWIPSKSEDLYWNKYEKNEGQRVSKFGELVFDNFKPTEEGLNLEIYPVGITKADYLESNKYKIKPNAGLDVMYNPSPALKFLFTANPDFAQIEADPYQFNISQYESYYNEKRPFFTEGNEVFAASGKERNTGFYSPLELFYSRRIGKKLTDGSEVPLILGTKAFGRLGNWEYAGFLAATDQKSYMDDTVSRTEPRALFGAARVKTTFGENSSIGTMVVAKQTTDTTYGVVDIDGAFRQPDWQLSYQIARSYINSSGDYAFSAGLVSLGNKWWVLDRSRYVGKNFNIEQIGFVPWIGTWQNTFLTGPNWYFKDGWISQILVLGGLFSNYKNVETFTDCSGAIDFNMSFRDNWGYELTVLSGKAKDNGVKYDYFEFDYSTYFNIGSKWNGDIYGGYSKTYNWNRDYVAFFSWHGLDFNWNANNIMQLGTSYNMWIEGNPAGGVENITYDARPYISLTPVNNLNIRMYVDNLYDNSSQHLEQIISGFLFSYNFRPKSWIYFAYNELDNRSDQYDSLGNLLPQRMHVALRAGVFKVKYLYYF